VQSLPKLSTLACDYLVGGRACSSTVRAGDS
jgi:hypothetical protein